MALRSFIILALILFSLVPVSPAEQSDTFDLGEIVVAKEGRLNLKEVSTLKVTSQDIEARDAKDVAKALDFTPGLRVTLGAKNEPDIRIRGFGHDKALILLDGIPVASPFFSTIDFDQIPTESISTIKVIKSSVSPLYGPNALAGVINIVSKEPLDKPSFEFTSSFSQHKTKGYALSFGAKDDDVSFWLSGGYRESGGFDLSNKFKPQRNESGDLRDNSFYEKKSFSLKFGLERFARHKPVIFFNYIDNQKGIPPSVSSDRPRFWRFTEWKRLMVGVGDEFQIRDDFSIKAKVFYDKYDNTLKSFDDPSYTTQNNPSSWTSVFDEYAFGSSLYFDYDPCPAHSLRLGLNFKDDVHKEQGDIGAMWEEYEFRTYSLGLEDEIRVGERLVLLVGASFDWLEPVRAFGSSNRSTIDSFNPVLSADLSLTDRTHLYSSVSQRTHFPTMNHLFAQTSGNPDLNEQKNINGEVGLNHDLSKDCRFSIAYFYNDVEDLIDRLSRNDPYLNISEATIQGGEVSFKAKITKFLQGLLSYTYINARDKDPALFSRSSDELPNVAEHKADCQLKFNTDFGLSFDILGSYVGRRPYYDNGGAQHFLGGYFVFNSRIAQDFLENWQASLFIENILDRNYQEEEGFPQAGRTFFFTIKGIF